jgi:hypothetical protein
MYLHGLATDEIVTLLVKGKDVTWAYTEKTTLPTKESSAPLTIILIQSELLGFWTLFIAWNSKYYKTQRFGHGICFHPQVRGGRHLL